jgi:three-Cys-motif partner protein
MCPTRGGELLSRSEELQHLKRVSRVKHIILAKYFPSWAKILGTQNIQLAYADCFAGPGQYEMEGKPVEGSPVIVIREAVRLLQGKHVENLLLYLIDDDPEQIEKLKVHLSNLLPYPRNLDVTVSCVNSRTFVPSLLQKLHSRVPAFFLIDPYGHPLPVPTIRSILLRQRTEVFINLMWFQINRDLNNPKVESRLNDLFGDNVWRSQPYMKMHGMEREKAFLSYFMSRLGCAYVQPFRIRYDVEDGQHGNRTKYYLLHASNHVKAALLMKEIMWPLGDEEGTFDYSGESQGVLISQTPTELELKDILLRKFKGMEMSFDVLREQTWSLPFIPKHYRAALKAMERKEVKIKRITSKQTGISGDDLICFV